jgi:hypothetical protein
MIGALYAIQANHEEVFMPIPQLFSFCLASTMLFGCSAGASVNTANTPPNGGSQPGAQSSTAADGTTLPNFAFTPAVNQTFSVSLPSKMDGGYQWHLLTTFDSHVVTAVGLGSANTASRTGVKPAGGLLGAFAPEIFDFKALAAGKTTLSFSLYRSFEGPDKAGAPTTFTVTVQ